MSRDTFRCVVDCFVLGRFTLDRILLLWWFLWKEGDFTNSVSVFFVGEDINLL